MRRSTNSSAKPPALFTLVVIISPDAGAGCKLFGLYGLNPALTPAQGTALTDERKQYVNYGYKRTVIGCPLRFAHWLNNA